MRYKITHTTSYQYSAPVSNCYNLAHIIPRTSNRQACISSQVDILPIAQSQSIREDYFGNKALHFEIQNDHNELSLTATSIVETQKQTLLKPIEQSPSVSESQALINSNRDPYTLLAREFLLDSPMIGSITAINEFSHILFSADKPLLLAVLELTQKIYKEFTYCPEATTLATPLSEVLQLKKGVCQDFAHLQIACLRSLGIPAKYISGYIETLPLPGQEKLVGTDATHAWLSVFCPGFGWVEFDPTNNCLVGDQHIITAWGRDYSDVTPLRGVIYGGGDDPIMSVSVDVSRCDPPMQSSQQQIQNQQ
ncbi:transglutaminase N-terminal domain-containing protein [Agaribacterium sp. ZY112]|uniref:transglutaminase family protein n=1 Tax=Agaribacterium sp. ZY112 TaxID=3233574 RepID=UPI0035261403